MFSSSLLTLALVFPSIALAVPPPLHLSRAAADAQTSLTLDPSQVQPNLASDGQAVAEAGQVASLTSTNNFINFCLTQKTSITNGLQTKTGSCNPTIMGRILATTNLPSSKFIFPKNGGTVDENATFTIQMGIKNMVTGNFVNAQSNYYSAPCQVDSSGTVIGHSHIVVEKVASLDSTELTDPNVFAFFKGLNAVAVNGVLTADVTGGLAAGAYRLASINTCANHQPVLGSVAQHGSFDDMIYFTVKASGASAVVSASTNVAAGGNAQSTTTPAAATTTARGQRKTTTSVAVSSTSTLTDSSIAVASITTVASSTPIALGTAVAPSVIAASSSIVTSSAISSSNSIIASNTVASSNTISTSSAIKASSSIAAIPTSGPTSANLQTFTGSLGSSTAPPVTGPGADGRFTCNGNTFATVQAAKQRSCDIQHNACALKANQSGNVAPLNQAGCAQQQTQCQAA